jgi:hypothetical protein
VEFRAGKRCYWKAQASWAWGYIPIIIPVTLEAEKGEWWLEASLGKVSMGPYLRKKL